jgi:hypothetical protein
MRFFRSSLTICKHHHDTSTRTTEKLFHKILNLHCIKFFLLCNSRSSSRPLRALPILPVVGFLEMHSLDADSVLVAQHSSSEGAHHCWILVGTPSPLLLCVVFSYITITTSTTVHSETLRNKTREIVYLIFVLVRIPVVMVAILRNLKPSVHRQAISSPCVFDF